MACATLFYLQPAGTASSQGTDCSFGTPLMPGTKEELSRGTHLTVPASQSASSRYGGRDVKGGGGQGRVKTKRQDEEEEEEEEERRNSRKSFAPIFPKPLLPTCHYQSWAMQQQKGMSQSTGYKFPQKQKRPFPPDCTSLLTLSTNTQNGLTLEEEEEKEEERRGSVESTLSAKPQETRSTASSEQAEQMTVIPLSVVLIPQNRARCLQAEKQVGQGCCATPCWHCFKPAGGWTDEHWSNPDCSTRPYWWPVSSAQQKPPPGPICETYCKRHLGIVPLLQVGRQIIAKVDSYESGTTEQDRGPRHSISLCGSCPRADSRFQLLLTTRLLLPGPIILATPLG
ncbi:unnamed protein product [Leuciscus chuanchicus]